MSFFSSLFDVSSHYLHALFSSQAPPHITSHPCTTILLSYCQFSLHERMYLSRGTFHAIFLHPVHEFIPNLSAFTMFKPVLCALRRCMTVLPPLGSLTTKVGEHLGTSWGCSSSLSAMLARTLRSRALCFFAPVFLSLKTVSEGGALPLINIFSSPVAPVLSKLKKHLRLILRSQKMVFMNVKTFSILRKWLV